jgi:hypothetical protein
MLASILATCGAGKGNLTLVLSLEGFNSAIELCPLNRYLTVAYPLRSNPLTVLCNRCCCKAKAYSFQYLTASRIVPK